MWSVHDYGLAALLGVLVLWRSCWLSLCQWPSVSGELLAPRLPFPSPKLAFSSAFWPLSALLAWLGWSTLEVQSYAGELASRAIEVSKPKLAKLSFAAVTSLSGYGHCRPSLQQQHWQQQQSMPMRIVCSREHSIDGNTAALLILKTEK